MSPGIPVQFDPFGFGAILLQPIAKYAFKAICEFVSNKLEAYRLSKHDRRIEEGLGSVVSHEVQSVNTGSMLTKPRVLNRPHLRPLAHRGRHLVRKMLMPRVNPHSTRRSATVSPRLSNTDTACTTPRCPVSEDRTPSQNRWRRGRIGWRTARHGSRRLRSRSSPGTNRRQWIPLMRDQESSGGEADSRMLLGTPLEYAM